MRKASLCIITRNNNKQILLAMKKRGFGVGKWNGPGGKVDAEKGDKNILDTAIRETQEEMGIKLKNVQELGFISFYFPYNKDWDQDVHIFMAKEWEGRIEESEEMFPKWFDLDNIPFNEMWDDDKYWLLDVLKGKKIKKASFVFGQDGKVKEHNVELI